MVVLVVETAPLKGSFGFQQSRASAVPVRVVSAVSGFRAFL